MNTPRTKLTLGSLILLLMAQAGYASVVDFEQVNSVVPFEGMTISNQFQANFGIAFRRRQGIDLFPVIGKFGPPQTGFTSSKGEDTLNLPNASDFGDYFLTDSAASTTGGTGIILDFSGTVSKASGYIFDIDATESVTVIAYGDSGATNALDTRVFNAGATGTGDGKAALWSFTRPQKDILRVDIISNNSSVGYDNFSSDYEPPPQAPAETAIRMLPGVTINGDVGRPYRLDYADTLDQAPGSTNWHALATIFLPRSPYLHIDLSATNTPARLYRAVGVP